MKSASGWLLTGPPFRSRVFWPTACWRGQRANMSWAGFFQADQPDSLTDKVPMLELSCPSAPPVSQCVAVALADFISLLQQLLLSLLKPPRVMLLSDLQDPKLLLVTVWVRALESSQSVTHSGILCCAKIKLWFLAWGSCSGTRKTEALNVVIKDVVLLFTSDMVVNLMPWLDSRLSNYILQI